MIKSVMCENIILKIDKPRLVAEATRQVRCHAVDFPTLAE